MFFLRFLLSSVSLWLCLTFSAAAFNISGEVVYKNCTGLQFQFDGYTYQLDSVTGEKVSTCTRSILY